MRLLDQIVQARSPLQVVDAAGLQTFRSASDYGPDVAACPIRFVMDRNAASRCEALIESDVGMLSAENGFLRMPAGAFWLEWPCPPHEDAGSRTGVLVEADERGRAGRITTFWEQATGEPVPAQAVILFDLDKDCISQSPAGEGLALTPGLHPLAPNLLFVIDDAWSRHFERGGSEAFRRATEAVVFGLISAVEFLFVFSALLSERVDLERREVDLGPLNRRRAKRGKPALLDHIEVRLDLAAQTRVNRTRLAGARRTPRLHHVRGHMVGRGGALFWRRSHLRGDASAPVSSRTVAVTARGCAADGEPSNQPHRRVTGAGVAPSYSTRRASMPAADATGRGV